MVASSNTDTTKLPEALGVEVRLKIEQVSALVGWGRAKIYSEIREQRFPSPERRGNRCSRWRAGDILDWLHATRGRPAGSGADGI